MKDMTFAYWLRFLPTIWRVTKVKDGRLVLLAKHNTFVFDTLERLGCFKFYETNSGLHVIGVSQVVLFLDHGWKALRNGFTMKKGEMEVHHIDGDVTNNDPKNLVALDKDGHAYISACSNTPRWGRAVKPFATTFNRQGRPVSDPYRYLVEILAETVKKVAKARTNSVVIISIHTALLSLPKKLYRKVLEDICRPAWMCGLVVKALFTDDPNMCYAYKSY